MKQILLTITLALAVGIVSGQTTYYWVGGTNSATMTASASWNTSIDGTGNPRPAPAGASDILVFDGQNLGGTNPVTAPAIVQANGAITCAQMIFRNNVSINMQRVATGTTTITFAGEAGDDFVITAGSTLAMSSTSGSIAMALPASFTGRVSGTFSMISNSGQLRMSNGLTGSPNSLVFTSGSSFTTNIVSASSSYAFGSATQSSVKWVSFEDGAHLYYDGGFSPIGNNSVYTAIDFKPASTLHLRAAAGGGSFFNARNFGHVVVENGASFISDGPAYKINDLTIAANSSLTTYTSGQTAVLGNLTVNGTLTSVPASSNTLTLTGNGNQAINGTGIISVNNLVVGSETELHLNKNISVEGTAIVYGQLYLNQNQITGTASFSARNQETATAITGDLAAGSYTVSNATGIGPVLGMRIMGTGIPANTTVISFNATSLVMTLSKPAVSSAIGTALTFATDTVLLQTANTGGIDGSLALTGNKLYAAGTNYQIDAATSTPFGISTGSSATSITAGRVKISAPVTGNSGLVITDKFQLDNKFTLRPSDTIHLAGGASIIAAGNGSAYIAMERTGNTTGRIIIDAVSAPAYIPVGSPSNFLPFTIAPQLPTDLSIFVYEGVTVNGAINGNPFSAGRKQNLVNAVWDLRSLNNSSGGSIQLNWTPQLEGSTFATLPGTDIGVISNSQGFWSAPLATGDNTTNTAAAVFSSFGAFGVSAIPQLNPFLFNQLPSKTYGDPAFNGGATSLNEADPITYTSSNPNVAVIVNGDIKIVGAGTSVITASQPSDGNYPAASFNQTLTVAKASLVIKAEDKIKFEGEPLPVLTATYTGFVYNDNTGSLLTPALVQTTAVASSGAGTYPITVSGATSANYTITQVAGVLTVQPKQAQVISFAAIPAKTYGNADFTIVVSSSNTSIPVIVTSSNPAVAIITGNLVHIVGAGTTTLTATQVGSIGYFAAAPVPQVLTVNKAPLTIAITDTVRNQGQPNPEFNIRYAGFVAGETIASLQSPAVASTIATASSGAGYYVVTPTGAVTANYNITYTPGRLTILPASTTEPSLLLIQNNSSMMTVRIYSPAPAIGDVVLYDLNGEQMGRKNVFMPKGFINVTFNISKMVTGIYAVNVQGPGVHLKQLFRIIR